MKYLILLLNLLFCINTFGQSVLVITPDASNSKDCEIFSLQPTTNFQSPILRGNAWTFSGSVGIQRSMIQFDMSKLPQNIIIDSAYLSLFSPSPDNNQTHSGENDAIIKRITKSWDLTSINWNNQPTTTDLNAVKIKKSIAADQDYKNLDVTKLINDILKGTEGNNGFLISLENETTFRRISFASSRHPNPGKRPTLKIYYKIKCDGTLVTLKPNANVGKDAEVFSRQPTQNLNGQVLRSNHWTFSGSPGVIRGLIDFDLNSLPQNANIKSAYLSLFSPDSNITEFHTGENNSSYLSRIIEPWSETLVTWNNQPKTTEVNRVSLEKSIAERQDYLDINVTNLIKDQIKNKDKSFGFMLSLQDESVVFNRMAFCSSDNLNPLKHPSLEVCYSDPTNIEWNDKQSIILYPNPGSEIVFFRNLKNYKEILLQFISQDGRLVLSKELTGENLEVNISLLSTGNYKVLGVSNNEVIFVENFVKVN
jgi:hypothetical protein